MGELWGSVDTVPFGLSYWVFSLLDSHHEEVRLLVGAIYGVYRKVEFVIVTTVIGFFYVVEYGFLIDVEPDCKVVFNLIKQEGPLRTRPVYYPVIS